MLYYILPLYKYVVLYSPLYIPNDLQSIYTYVYFCSVLKMVIKLLLPKNNSNFFCVLLKNFKICFLISKREAKSHYQAFCTFFAFRVSSLMQPLLLPVIFLASLTSLLIKKLPHPYLILRAKIFKYNYYLPYENISNISLQCTFIATTKSVIYFSPVKTEPSCN